MLPTAWFRNTWSWGDTEEPGRPCGRRGTGPSPSTTRSRAPWSCSPRPARTVPARSLLFCENETNFAGLYGGEAVTPYPKDGINDHVIGGAATVNPVGTGTKCAFWYQVTVPPGQTAELRLRLRPAAGGNGKQRTKAQADPLGKDFDQGDGPAQG